MTADDSTRFGGHESSDDTRKTPRGSFGPILDTFRATKCPGVTAADVADQAPDLTEADAAAALRQLEVDGVAMSTELRCGTRLWYLDAYEGGDTLADAREQQELYRETHRAAASLETGARGD
jgi:hypothetical protein